MSTPPPATATAPAPAAPGSRMWPVGPHLVIAPEEAEPALTAALTTALSGLPPLPDAVLVLAAAPDAAPVLRRSLPDLVDRATGRGAARLVLAASGLAAPGPDGTRPVEAVATTAGFPVIAPDGMVTVEPDGSLRLAPPGRWWLSEPGAPARALDPTWPPGVPAGAERAEAVPGPDTDTGWGAAPRPDARSGPDAASDSGSGSGAVPGREAPTPMADRDGEPGLGEPAIGEPASAQPGPSEQGPGEPADSDDDRAAPERIAPERIAPVRVDAEGVGADRVDAEGVGADRVDAEGVDVERVAPERVDAEEVDVERVGAEEVDRERFGPEGGASCAGPDEGPAEGEPPLPLAPPVPVVAESDGGAHGFASGPVGVAERGGRRIRPVPGGFWLGELPEGVEPLIGVRPDDLLLGVGSPQQPALPTAELLDLVREAVPEPDGLLLAAPWADPAELTGMAVALAARSGRTVRVAVGLPVRTADDHATSFLDGRGAPTWQPLLVELTASPEHRRVVPSAWLRLPGLDATAPAVHRAAAEGWVLETVPAGLWLRPEGRSANPWPRMLRPDPARPVLVVGDPDRGVAPELWEALPGVLAALPDLGAAAPYGLLFHGPATDVMPARAWAGSNGLDWLGPAEGAQRADRAPDAPATPSTDPDPASADAAGGTPSPAPARLLYTYPRPRDRG
ncbi:hypothetical protein, partial [Streptomyces bambusae]